MAFYVRHTATKVIWRVHKIPADAPDGLIDPGEALTYPLSEKTDQGYYGVEGSTGMCDRLFGPYETEDEAREALWVEDV